MSEHSAQSSNSPPLQPPVQHPQPPPQVTAIPVPGSPLFEDHQWMIPVLPFQIVVPDGGDISNAINTFFGSSVHRTISIVGATGFLRTACLKTGDEIRTLENSFFGVNDELDYGTTLNVISEPTGKIFTGVLYDDKDADKTANGRVIGCSKG